jgi:hypothetical protein
VQTTAIVTVTSRATPAISWPCRSCGRPQTFDASERLRVNANGKLVDIWLIYRCRRCEATKNITVVERRPVGRVPAELLARAQANDAGLARALARDLDLLRRGGVRVTGGDEWEIAGPACVGERLRVVFPEPLLVRVDAVLASALGIPRRAVGASVRVADGSPRLDALRLWSDLEVDLEPSPPRARVPAVTASPRCVDAPAAADDPLSRCCPVPEDMPVVRVLTAGSRRRRVG